MLAFSVMSLNSQGPPGEFKSKNKIDVRTFDYRFVQDYCNTVIALLNVMFTVNGTVQLNSVGSNPAEHFIRLINMRSRSLHTISCFELCQKLFGENDSRWARRKAEYRPACFVFPSRCRESSQSPQGNTRGGQWNRVFNNVRLWLPNFG